jgi:hypothetical protein
MMAAGGVFDPAWTDLQWSPMLPGYTKRGLLNPFKDYS